ncbi:MAG TPA: hypothetical protein VMR70_15430 [Flavisolibacter sp.]|nr:hypothetical protein [Flavisolibacter sp.]
MKQLLIAGFALCLFVGCKSKKDNKPGVSAADFFPVNDYLNGQIAQLDTSLYTFLKIETVDGRSDTTAIRNTDVKTYAKDFKELPDLSDSDIKDDYSVDKFFDDIQNGFVFTYTTKEDHPVQQQQVTVEPAFNEKGQNDIRSVFVDLWQSEDGVTVRKRMMWEATNFYITTTTEAEGQPQKTKTTKIIWNGFANQTE